MKKTLLWLSALAWLLTTQAVDADAVTPPDVLYASAFRSQGLGFPGAKPWHLRAHYTVFEGKRLMEGTFEEWWMAPRVYKLTYSRKGFEQTDYATDAGLYRVGEQPWPSGYEASITQLLTQPMPPIPDANEVQIRTAVYEGGEPLRCVELAYDPGLTNPVFCVDTGRPALRLSALQDKKVVTTYNSLTRFQGHYVAGDIQKIVSGAKVFSLTVDSIEDLPSASAAMLTPPPGASPVSLAEITLPANTLRPLKTTLPAYPSIAKQNHSEGKVIVRITVDRLGHVIKINGATGPVLLRQPAIDCISKWIFEPYLLFGEPVQVDTEFNFIFQVR